MYKTIPLVCLLLVHVSICYSQKANFKNYPDSADEIIYFDLLYSKNGSINSPITNIIKLEFLDCELFAVANKNGLNAYCKKKYAVNDSLANLMGMDILIHNKKLPASDTIHFKEGQKQLFSISILKSFREMSLIDFLNKYVKRSDPANIFVMAYLFEKRILYDLSYSWIPISYDLMRSKYGLQWNKMNNEWTVEK